jgi:hypothetical protein
MKIQLGDKTYHTVHEGCCLDCVFWSDKPVSLSELQGICRFPFKCAKPLKKKLFNDGIFKL